MKITKEIRECAIKLWVQLHIRGFDVCEIEDIISKVWNDYLASRTRRYIIDMEEDMEQWI